MLPDRLIQGAGQVPISIDARVKRLSRVNLTRQAAATADPLADYDRGTSQSQLRVIGQFEPSRLIELDHSELEDILNSTPTVDASQKPRRENPVRVLMREYRENSIPDGVTRIF